MTVEYLNRVWGRWKTSDHQFINILYSSSVNFVFALAVQLKQNIQGNKQSPLILDSYCTYSLNFLVKSKEKWE